MRTLGVAPVDASSRMGRTRMTIRELIEELERAKELATKGLRMQAAEIRHNTSEDVLHYLRAYEGALELIMRTQSEELDG